MNYPTVAVATIDSQSGVDVTRSSALDNPWRKACVLSLDGGGIRGYASLWMLKILMDAIEAIEKEHPEPHESSFWPKIPEHHISNGTIGDPSIGRADIIAPSPRARTSSTLESRRNYLSFRRQNTESQPTEPQPLDSTEANISLHDEGFLPCHYFDYIAGASTGGLNAIMLGRLRMKVEDCLQQYPEMAENIFTGQKKSKAKRAMMFRSSKYDSARLEAQVKRIVGLKTPQNGAPRQTGFDFDKFHSPEDLCKTVVVANEDSEGKAEAPYLFRTYPQPSIGYGVKNGGRPADGHEIWKIARATSAAPTFFDPIELGGKEYSDGGIGNNNPVQLMLTEVRAKSNIGTISEAFGAIVSIGAGQNPTTRLKVKHKFPRFSSLKPIKELSKIVKSLRTAATDVERPHLWVLELMEEIKFEHYYRWTGGEEVGGLEMDEWNPYPKGNKPTTANFIENQVKDYMKQPAVLKSVKDCARELVNRRRARVGYQADLGQWRRHAHCTLIPCPYCGTLFENRHVVKRHIETGHEDKLMSSINLDDLVKFLTEVHPMCRGGPL